MAVTIPKIPARKERKRFKKTFSIPIKQACSFKMVIVSNVKEEKVVNAPKNPTTKKYLYKGSKDVCRKTCIKRVTRNEPTTFTSRVPTGKVPEKNLVDSKTTKNLARAPKAPPKAMRRYFAMEVLPLFVDL